MEQTYQLLDYNLVGAVYPALGRLASTEEYEAYIGKALELLDSRYEQTGRDASYALATWAVLLPAAQRLADTGILTAQEAADEVLRIQGTRFAFRDQEQACAELPRLTFLMDSEASRFSRSAIVRSPYFEDALTLLNMCSLTGNVNPGQLAFWNDVAAEEPEQVPAAEDVQEPEEEALPDAA